MTSSEQDSDGNNIKLTTPVQYSPECISAPRHVRTVIV